MAIQYVQRPFKSAKSSSNSSSVTEQTGTTTDNRIVTVKTVTDDGAGNLPGTLGTVNYAGKSASLKVVDFSRSTQAYKADYEKASAFENSVENGAGSSDASNRKGGDYSTASIGEEVLAGSSVVARYRVGTPAPTAKAMTYTPAATTINLTPYSADPIVPGSVQFTWMGETYTDFEGTLYRGRTESTPGIASGTIDYASGIAVMTDWVVAGDHTAFSLQSLWTRKGQWKTAALFFNTTSAPLRAGAGGFVLSVVDTQGDVLTANVNAQGVISGAHMWGKVQFSTGAVELQFGDFVDDATLTPADKAEWWYSAADVGTVQAGKIWRPWPVDPTTLRYSIVSYIYLPIDSELLGLDPTALPPDGKVAVFRPGDLLVAAKTIDGLAFTPSAMTYNVGTTRLSLVRVLDDATGLAVEEGFTVDLDAGTVTITDTTGWPASVRVYARQEVYRRIAEVRVDGTVRLTSPVGMDLAVGDIISSALRQGDLFARVKRVYDQQTWDGVSWADGLDGDQALASYDTTNHPLEISNLGGITERWALRFKADATQFDLIGQHLGQIATGSKTVDFTPINPASGAPYFTLRAAGWGNGWVAGNVLFVDTVGASYPIDVIRSVQPGTPPGGDYSFLLEQRGDVDTPPASPFP